MGRRCPDVSTAWNYAKDNEALANYFVESFAGGRPGKKKENRFGPVRYPIPAGIQTRRGDKRHMAPRELVEANREDFKQAALIGLYRASERGFDPTKGEDSTLAAFYVHEELNKVLKALRPARDASLDEERQRDRDDGKLSKKAARRRVREGDDCSISAEEESLRDNHSHTSQIEVGGETPASPPPTVQRTEADASNPCAAEGARAGVSQPPSAAAPKAGLSIVQRRDALKAVDFLKARGEPKLAAAVFALNKEVIELRREVKRKLHEDGLKLTRIT
jgi:hypothetical protein